MLQRTLPAGFIAPCLPTKTEKLPSGDLRLHEIKHDGFRVSTPSETPRDLADFQNRHGEAPRFAGKEREIELALVASVARRPFRPRRPPDPERSSAARGERPPKSAFL
jgi:hypothetical protein